MKFSALFIVAVMLLGCAERGPVGPEAGSKTAAAAPAAMPFKVLDVRSPDEFEEGHIAGAINLPVDRLEKGVAAVVAGKDTPIVLHCASGFRSARAAKILGRLGYSNVQDLGSMANAEKEISRKLKGGQP
jgi:phage shock protein E